MQETHPRARRPHRRRFLVPVLIAVTAAMAAGCLSDDASEGGADPAAAPSATGETWVEAWDASGRPALPAAAELETALGLSESQSAAITVALDTWRGELETRLGAGSERPGHGTPGGIGDFEPPMLGFLQAVVPSLEGGQIDGLVSLLEEKRDARPEDGRARPGRRPHGGPMGFVLRELADELDLSDTQSTELRAALEESRETFRALREAFQSEEITAEGLRDAARTARETLESAFAGILSESQLALVEEALAEHRAEVATRRLEHLETSVERRLEFLTTVLTLDEAQVATIAAILADSLPERRAILEALRDGTIEIEDALYRGYVLAQAASASIRETLTSEQATIFDALKSLLPGHRGPRSV